MIKLICLLLALWSANITEMPENIDTNNSLTGTATVIIEPIERKETVKDEVVEIEVIEEKVESSDIIRQNSTECKIEPTSEIKVENVIDGIKYTNIFNAEETNRMIDDVIKASKDNDKMWKNGKMNFDIKVEMRDNMKNAFFFPYLYERVYRYVNKGSLKIITIWASDYYVNDEFCYTEYFIK